MSYIPFNDISENNPGYDVKSDPNPAIAIRMSTGELMRFDYLAARNYNDAIDTGKVPILYHFAGGRDPATEAQLFTQSVSPYSVGDVYCLDWEVTDFAGDPVAWCLQFMTAVHDATGVWPWLYTYRAMIEAHDWSPVTQNSGLWIAAPDVSFDTDIPSVGLYIAQQGPIVDGHDTDAFFGSLDQLKAYGYKEPAHDNPSPAPAADPAPAPADPAPAPQPALPTADPVPAAVEPAPVVPNPGTPSAGTAIDVIVKPTITKETPMNPIKAITAVENTVVAHPEEIATVAADASRLKAGWKTTEFWATLATDVAALAGAVLPSDSLAMKITGLLTIAVITATYVAGRAKIKAAQS